ncbi:unnamed protein product, partial [Urochloa humidicola]
WIHWRSKVRIKRNQESPFLPPGDLRVFLPQLLHALVFHLLVWMVFLGIQPAVQAPELQALVVEPAVIKLQVHVGQGCL